jgi:hypothetical protein
MQMCPLQPVLKGATQGKKQQSGNGNAPSRPFHAGQTTACRVSEFRCRATEATQGLPGLPPQKRSSQRLFVALRRTDVFAGGLIVGTQNGRRVAVPDSLPAKAPARVTGARLDPESWFGWFSWFVLVRCTFEEAPLLRGMQAPLEPDPAKVGLVGLVGLFWSGRISRGRPLSQAHCQAAEPGRRTTNRLRQVLF